MPSKYITEHTIEVTCPNGHTYRLDPIVPDPEGGGLYSSSLDFCKVCEEPIDHSTLE